jgi:hypothetical protein
VRSRILLTAVLAALLAALVVAPLADGNRQRTHDASVSIQAKPATNVTPTTTTLSASFTFGCSGFAYAYWKITLAGQGGGPDGSASSFKSAGTSTVSFAIPNLHPGDSIDYHFRGHACGDDAETTTYHVKLPAVLTLGVASGLGTVNGAGQNCRETCSTWWAEGDAVTLTAVPDAGYRFASWDGACAGQGAVCTTTVIGTATTKASFTPVHKLSVTRSGDGTGTVTSAPAGITCGATCSASYDPSTTITLTAAAADDSTFAGWSGACTGTAPTCAVALSEDRAVTASFDRKRRLSIALQGRGTVASAPAGIDCPSGCAATFPRHTGVTLTATPEDGWAFISWSGDCSGTTCAVTLDEDAHVSALFRPFVTVTVTRTGKGAGTVTSTPSGIACGKHCTKRVVAGTTVTLHAKASKGSRFDHWAGGCARFKSAPACTLKLTRAAGVIAAFAPARKG